MKLFKPKSYVFSFFMYIKDGRVSEYGDTIIFLAHVQVDLYWSHYKALKNAWKVINEKYPQYKGKINLW